MTAEVVTDARRLLVTKVRVEHNWNQYYNTTGIDCEQRYLALTGKMFNNASCNVITVTMRCRVHVHVLRCLQLLEEVGFVNVRTEDRTETLERMLKKELKRLTDNRDEFLKVS